MHKEDIVNQLESYSKLIEDNTIAPLLRRAAEEILCLSNQLQYQVGKSYDL